MAKLFLSAISCYPGTVGSPGLYLGSDTTTGLYRIGANNIGVAISGSKVLDILSTGLTVTGTVTGTSFTGAGTGLTGTAASLTAGIASVVTLTADNSTNATNYPLFVNAATGNLSPRTDTGFTYNPSTGDLTTSGTLYAASKSFKIDHPIKAGKKLVHGSLEGPENGVYIRGRNKDGIIYLPDYWVGLVNEDSITVQLTAIDRGQKLYVKYIKGNRVYIANDNILQKTIDCFYFIQAERKDLAKLEVEQ